MTKPPITHETEMRIAMLLDELLRRGVPEELVQAVVDWLDAQRRERHGIR